MWAFQQHKCIVAQFSRCEVHTEGGAGPPPSKTCRGLLLWWFSAPGGLLALSGSAWLEATSLQALDLSSHGTLPACLSLQGQLLLFIEIWLIYNVVLISAVQQSDSIIHIYIYTHLVFHLLFHSLFAFLVVKLLIHVQYFATLGIVARQGPLSLRFYRQEYCSGWPCPPHLAHV